MGPLVRIGCLALNQTSAAAPITTTSVPASSQAGGNVTTDEFIALAERISGQQLDELFQTWLFTPQKPALVSAVAARAASVTADLRHAPPAARSLIERFGKGL